ncbi:MAG: hypothetical protein R3F56_21295 [Planctomycetota bacterium]
MRHLRSISIWMLPLAGLAAQRPIFTTSGTANQNLGQALLVVEDLDGDGWREVVVGAPGDATNGADAGAILVLSGRTRSTLWSVRGTQAGARFGAALAAIGDLDQDGIAELAVGSPLQDGGPFGPFDTGAVTILHFAPRSGYTVLGTLLGANSNELFGSAIAAVGDFDNDGVPDFAVGAPQWGFSAGRVAVHSGVAPRFALLTGFASTVLSTDQLGSSLTGLYGGSLPWGFAAGAPGADAGGLTDNGMVKVITSAGTYEVRGGASGDQFGWSVAGLGDQDGDGVPDLAVGAIGDSTGHPQGGAVHALSGSNGAQLAAPLRGETPGDRLGFALASGVDFDADAQPDLAIGARGDDNLGADSGCVYLMSIRSVPGARVWVPLMVLNGQTSGEALGGAVALGPSGPGALPAHSRWVLAGAPTHGSGAGLVRAFDQNLPVATTFAGTAGDRTGTSVVGLGDVDGDGRGDFAFSSPGRDVAAQVDLGAVDVVSGATGGVAWTRLGSVAGEQFGQRVSAIGDLDGDGLADLMAAMPQNPNNPTNGDAWRVDSPSRGIVLRRATRAQVGANSQLAAAIDDVDADGYPDHALSPDGRILRLFSGRTGVVLRDITVPTAFGVSSYGGAGDLDRDGFDDVVAQTATPRSAWLYSGRNGALLASESGTTRQVGDVDRDGFIDYVVVQNTRADLFSGRTHATLANWDSGLLLATTYGDAAALGDVDADGHPDFALAFMGSWVVRSGRDFSMLAAYRSSGSLVGVGDLDQDGYPDLVLGDPNAGGGAGVVQRLQPIAGGGTPGSVQHRGRSCPGSNSALLRATADRPALNETTFAQLRGGLPNALAFLLLGGPIDIELSLWGAPGCHLYIDLAGPAMTFFVPTSPVGGALWPLPIPNDEALLGARFDVQWGVVDPAVNRAGLTLSNAVTLTVGRWQ